MNKKITRDSPAVKHLLKADKKFKTLCRLVGDLSYAPPRDPYDFVVKTIIGQMISTKVADALTERLTNICASGKIDPASVRQIPVETLRAIGLSWRKAQCVIDFTRVYDKKAYSQKSLSTLTDEEVAAKITATKGLGSWSAKMFLLFVLDRENVLPHEDAAFLQAFAWYENLPAATAKNAPKEISEKWSPHASTIARYLYAALAKGLTKQPFASYG